MVCSVSVMIPAWLPVKLSLGTPRSCRAMHSRAMALRSPAVISMSISRPGWVSGHLAGQVEELVGLLAHGGDGHHHLVAAAHGPGHVVRDGAHAIGVGDGGAAELHHQQGHRLRGYQRALGPPGVPAAALGEVSGGYLGSPCRQRREPASAPAARPAWRSCSRRRRAASAGGAVIIVASSSPSPSCSPSSPARAAPRRCHSSGSSTTAPGSCHDRGRHLDHRADGHPANGGPGPGGGTLTARHPVPKAQRTATPTSRPSPRPPPTAWTRARPTPRRS